MLRKPRKGEGFAWERGIKKIGFGDVGSEIARRYHMQLSGQLDGHWGW